MVKGLIQVIQFNICSATLTTNLLNTMPQYIVVFVMIIAIIIIIGSFFTIHKFFATINYYIKRKFDSIDKYTDKNGSDNNDKPPNTYKETRKKYKKNISDLEAHIVPDEQTVVNIVDKINELRKKK